MRHIGLQHQGADDADHVGHALFDRVLHVCGRAETARQTDNGAVKVELLDAGGEVGEVHASGSVLLVAGGGGEGRLFERSAGDLNQIKTEIGKMLDDLQGLVFGKFAGLAVRRVELDCHGGN